MYLSTVSAVTLCQITREGQKHSRGIIYTTHRKITSVLRQGNWHHQLCVNRLHVDLSPCRPAVNSDSPGRPAKAESWGPARGFRPPSFLSFVYALIRCLMQRMSKKKKSRELGVRATLRFTELPYHNMQTNRSLLQLFEKQPALEFPYKNEELLLSLAFSPFCFVSEGEEHWRRRRKVRLLSARLRGNTNRPFLPVRAQEVGREWLRVLGKWERPLM